jgi:hypothetical protein
MGRGGLAAPLLVRFLSTRKPGRSTERLELFLYAKPDEYPLFIAGLLALATTPWVRFADKHLLSFLLLQFSSWRNTR